MPEFGFDSGISKCINGHDVPIASTRGGYFRGYPSRLAARQNSGRAEDLVAAKTHDSRANKFSGDRLLDERFHLV